MSATSAPMIVADNGRPPIGDWDQITARAPRLAATVDAYLDELAATRSPATVHAVSATLRQFAGYVSVVDPHCTTAAGITGHHVGDYCLWLALHPDRRTRRTVSAGGIDRRIGELRRFFEHLAERGDVDAPALVPVPARRRRCRATAPDAADSCVVPAPRPAAIADWDEIAERAPQVAATMSAYLDQLAVSSRPRTVEAASRALRQFADHLTRSDPACVSVAAVERRHIESFKLALAARPGRRGTVSTETIRNRLGMLRTFFERIIDWDDPDAPRRVPVLAGDIPKADEPLPKFLDDPMAAKFMAALAVEPNKRRRLIVELLARTGMRVGELGGLRDDAMYRLGDTWWLRIPLGKLHNDRTVPLHPMLVGLINDYRRGADRPAPGCSSNATTTSRWMRAPSTVTSPPSPDAPASPTSTPTRCATRWPRSANRRELHRVHHSPRCAKPVAPGPATLCVLPDPTVVALAGWRRGWSE